MFQTVQSPQLKDETMPKQARIQQTESELRQQLITLIRSCGVSIDANMFFSLAFMTAPQLKQMLRKLGRTVASGTTCEAR